MGRTKHRFFSERKSGPYGVSRSGAAPGSRSAKNRFQLFLS
jgi:hypothetical protein